MATNEKPTGVVQPRVLSRTRQHEEQLRREQQIDETEKARMRRLLDRYLLQIEFLESRITTLLDEKNRLEHTIRNQEDIIRRRDTQINDLVETVKSLNREVSDADGRVRSFQQYDDEDWD